MRYVVIFVLAFIAACLAAPLVLPFVNQSVVPGRMLSLSDFGRRTADSVYPRALEDGRLATYINQYGQHREVLVICKNPVNVGDPIDVISVRWAAPTPSFYAHCFKDSFLPPRP